MDRPTANPLRIGDWYANPATGEIARDGTVVRPDPRVMRLLLYLAERSGQVVSVEELLDQVWSGVIVTPDSVYQGIAAVRRVLGDDPKKPTYIATVPRLGYRLIAPVSAWSEALHLPNMEVSQAMSDASPSGTTAASATAASVLPTPPLTAPPAAAPPLTTSPDIPHRRRTLLLALCASGLLLVALGFVLRAGLGAGGSGKSIAVLPFLDLTSESMDQEYFADGMTEELIDKLSHLPGVRVPSPASSFYFKGKKLPVEQIARSLGVAYVLSGSVRQSEQKLRIAVRLVRANDGYVIWSETYDRISSDKLLVQDDIATQVAKALKSSIS